MGKTFVNAALNLGGTSPVPNGTYTIGGNKVYIKNGMKHRDRGPAVIHRDGTKEYWKEGKLIKIVKPESTNEP